MKDFWRYTAGVFLGMAAVSLIALFLSLAAFDEGLWLWLRVLLSVLLMLAGLYFGMYSGILRGRKDKMYEISMEKQRQERGVGPSEEEKGRYFSPKKGILGALIAAAPGLLLAALVSVLSLTGGGLQMVLQPVLRLQMGLYLGLVELAVPGLAPHIFLPLTLLLPAAFALGYLDGPNQYAKMMKQIERGKRRRRRRRRRVPKQEG
ncbi:MAG: hypothetical protein LBD02_05745 [Christensenellaceae bacterium]|jgi:hypothetical protein|nr:hypothetical protein [Christensenellaceae bacterium]